MSKGLFHSIQSKLRKSANQSSFTQSITRKLLPDQDPSSAQKLPREILIRIFQYLITDDFTDIFEHVRRIPFVNNHHLHTLDSKIASQQKAIYYVMLTCKSWCSAGFNVLYSRPCLTSIDRIRLLARTLREAPSLSRFVQGIFVLNYVKSNGDRAPSPSQRRNNGYQTRPRMQDTKAHLEFILASCTNLDHIALYNDQHLVRILDDEDFVFGMPSFKTQLRTFTLYHSNSEFLTCIPQNDSRLSTLKTLCLRNVVFQSDNYFPVMSQLETLQLIRCHFDADCLPILPSELPSLVTLEAHENNRCPFEADGLQKLKRIELIGNAELEKFTTSWAKSGEQMASTIQLLLGGDWMTTYNELTNCELPPELQELTLFFPNSAQSEFTPILSSVRKLLEAHGHLKELKKVSMVYRPQVHS
ncbi:hypothetical protein C8Q75DRAFT_228465 [Abortiporus biennis]|nr:hypothetical protein C8Q75DRAFT_228465 [Abortiporus biennis]